MANSTISMNKTRQILRMYSQGRSKLFIAEQTIHTMNNDTLEKLRNLKFYGMLHAFKTSLESVKTNDYTADELLGYPVDAEWDDRNNRCVERQIYQARFRYNAVVENIHYHADRSLDRNQVMLADCSFITRNENLLITGSTGSAKLCGNCHRHQACIQGYRVFYASTPKLFAPLKNGQGRQFLYQGNRQD